MSGLCASEDRDEYRRADQHEHRGSTLPVHGSRRGQDLDWRPGPKTVLSEVSGCLERMDSTRFTYVGPPAYAGALAQELEDRGLSADYKPPFETKDLATAMAAVAVVFSVTGPLGDVFDGVRAFRSRFSGTRVDGLPEEERPSVRDRLAQVDQLLADGVISAAEHSEQRARVLSEL